MPLGEALYFHQGESIAIFTWHGCKVTVWGDLQEQWVSNDTQMANYANCHGACEEMRRAALKDKKTGPIVLVTGSTRSGKSTFCRMMINYALKLGWTPLFADIDLNSADIGPPGTIAVCQVDQPLPNDTLAEQSLCYFHGKTTAIT